jgi:predicted RNase H-like HicB family nuclease
MPKPAKSLHLTVEVEQETLSDGTKQFVASCCEVSIASQGASVEEATQNLEAAVRLWLDTASASEVENELP